MTTTNPARVCLLLLPLALTIACSSDTNDSADVAPDDATEGSDDATTDVDASGDTDEVDDSSPDLVEVEDSDTLEGSADVAVDDAIDGSADASADAVEDTTLPPLPEYNRADDPTAEFAAPEGWRWARSIVHLHSTHSHDACDDEPRPDGEYNLPCLGDLRAALCTTRVDIAWLTDHPTHFHEIPFTDALLHDEAAGDELIMDDTERPWANRVQCENGHEVIIFAGSEDRLMPLGFHQHIPGTNEERDFILNERDPETARIMRDNGALVWQAHSEERSIEDLRAVRLDGMEIYQLHANIDPNIRRDSLGLDPFAPLADLAPFAFGGTRTPPDLAVLAFLQENQPSLDRWAVMLAEQPMVGTGGTDAHQNVLPGMASDGERLDSYRRMISWFSNYLLVDGELNAESATDALANGRVFIGFDVLGSPSGFDAWLDVDGTRFPMGSTVSPGAAHALNITVPAPIAPDGTTVGSAFAIVYKANATAWEAVSEPLAAGDHEVALDGAGIYRVEVRTTGAHLAAWLVDLPTAVEREYPWIYSNAWRITEPG